MPIYMRLMSRCQSCGRHFTIPGVIDPPTVRREQAEFRYHELHTCSCGGSFLPDGNYYPHVPGAVVWKPPTVRHEDIEVVVNGPTNGHNGNNGNGHPYAMATGIGVQLQTVEVSTVEDEPAGKRVKARRKR